MSVGGRGSACLVLSCPDQRIRNVSVDSPHSDHDTRCRYVWEEYKDFDHFGVCFSHRPFQPPFPPAAHRSVQSVPVWRTDEVIAQRWSAEPSL